MDLPRHRFESYVPDIEDNRACWARGESAVVVEIKPPTAGDMRRWFRHVEASQSGVTKLPDTYLLDDRLVEPLWLACVGEIRGLTVEGVPVPDGAALWGLREEIGLPALFTNVLMAVQDRATFDAGLVRFLERESPSPESPLDNAGTATTAAAVT